MLSLKKVALIQGLMVAVCTIVLCGISIKQGAVFAFGAAVMTANFLFLKELLNAVLNKKSIALVTFVAVNKYAVLGGLLYFAVMRLKVPMLSFFCGMLTLLMSIVVATLIDYRTGKLKSAL